MPPLAISFHAESDAARAAIIAELGLLRRFRRIGWLLTREHDTVAKTISWRILQFQLQYYY